MKKEELIMIRIISVTAVLAVMALILVFGAGSGLFQNIINQINSNAVDLNSPAASIYNLYFYKGLNMIYMVLYSTALFSTVVAIVSILARYHVASTFVTIAAVSQIVIGIFILLAKYLEGSVIAHRFFASFYLDQLDNNMETAKMMPGIPLSAIFLMLLAILCMLLVKSSGMRKMKVYTSINRVKCMMLLAPMAFGSLFFELVREIMIGSRCESASDVSMSAYLFITDYYFANAWMFDWAYVWFLLAIACILIILRGRLSKLGGILITTLIPFLIIGIRGLVYYLNPPKLFGYLSFDETVCSATEAAFPLYMIVFLLDVIVLSVMAYQIVIVKCSNKKILIICGGNAAISIVLILILGGLFGLSGCYIGCIIADLVALIGSFYLTDISRGH